MESSHAIQSSCCIFLTTHNITSPRKMQQEVKYGDFSVDDICRRTGTMENSKLRSMDNK
jgi:hypothetical protein